MNTREDQLSTTSREIPTAPAPANPLPKVIGLTGGVASGKSTVARMFADLGAEVIDADAIAREVLRSSAVCEKLRQAWGEGIMGGNGYPDRAKISGIAFRAPEKLAELKAWVHPPTLSEMRSRLDLALQRRAAPLIVIDAPLLIESDLETWCDAILFVEADTERRATRAITARGWSPDEIARREKAQAALMEKRHRADAAIDNNGPLEETRAQVKRLVRKWIPSSRLHKPPSQDSEGEKDG